jgi:hypothetical protein
MIWAVGLVAIVVAFGALFHFVAPACACSPVKTARADMATIATAVEAYHTRWHVYTGNFAALSADLGSGTGPVGPGTRTYTVIIPAHGCTDNRGNPMRMPRDRNDRPGFCVRDNVTGDGVFCPGVSPN